MYYKKTLIVLTIILGLLITANAKADITNPVHKAKVENHFNGVAPFVYMLQACDSQYHIPTLEKQMELGYKISNSTDKSDKMLVDMMWPALWQLNHIKMGNMDFSDLIRFLKNNPEHPERISSCKHIDAQAIKSLNY